MRSEGQGAMRAAAQASESQLQSVTSQEKSRTVHTVFTSQKEHSLSQIWIGIVVAHSISPLSRNNSDVTPPLSPASFPFQLE